MFTTLKDNKKMEVRVIITVKFYDRGYQSMDARKHLNNGIEISSFPKPDNFSPWSTKEIFEVSSLGM